MDHAVGSAYYDRPIIGLLCLINIIISTEAKNYVSMFVRSRAR